MRRRSSRFSARFVALCSGLGLISASCGGGVDGASGDPSPEPQFRGGEPPADLATQVDTLRTLGIRISPAAELGTLLGTPSVDSGGRARYSIPIDVAPGRNGQQPRLSLSYSSGGPNGKLGLGFSMSGIASMERCRHSIADDGYSGSIEFEDDDAICFNGQKLAVVDGAYGQAGSEYRTIRDPRSKIVLEGADVDALGAQWVVYQPDGQILRFNTEVEHQALRDENDVPYRWLLGRAEDRFGNRVDSDRWDTSTWARTSTT